MIKLNGVVRTQPFLDRWQAFAKSRHYVQKRRIGTCISQTAEKVSANTSLAICRTCDG